MRKQVLVALVGLLGIAHAGILAHGPEASTIHGGLDTAGVRKFAGISDIAIVIPTLKIGRYI